MRILEKLPQILEESQNNYERHFKSYEVEELTLQERIHLKDHAEYKNKIVQGDNLELMKHLLKEKIKINLIYIDPPFFSKSDYKVNIKKASDKIESIPVIEQFAYKDTWKEGMADYLKMLCTRLFYMKDLLSETGSIFVHLDRHSVHYVKVLMDEIFGQDHFINEIIWSYKSGGVSKRYFARKHDTVLFYSKSENYHFECLKEKSYNRGLKPYKFKGVTEYQDENGWYTLVSMKDVWHLDMVGRTSGERVNYATQKPEALLERILLACSSEGDICVDFFGGSGTLASVASKLKRKWIICDMGKIACMIAHKRMVLKGVAYDMCAIGNTEKVESFIDFTAEVADKGKLHISLDRYGYKNDNEIPASPKYQETVKALMEEDSLKLIEYWSVDMDYDGHEFKPSWISCQESKEVVTDILLDYLAQERIAIRVLDVFGIETFVNQNIIKEVE